MSKQPKSGELGQSPRPISGIAWSEPAPNWGKDERGHRSINLRWPWLARLVIRILAWLGFDAVYLK